MSSTADHIDDLRAQARHNRDRFELYRARSFGSRPTDEGRLRELQRVSEQAAERLRFAEAEERRVSRGTV